MSKSYTPPVADLLTYEESHSVQSGEWPNYIEAFGFTKEHIPELLKLVQDDIILKLFLDKEETEVPADIDPELAWAALIHAWRALAQLQATDFVDVAIQLLETYQFEWMMQEFPTVFKLIGPSAIEPLAAVLQDQSSERFERMTYSESLKHIGQEYPEERDRCVTYLTNTLENHQDNDPSLNGSLTWSLIDLKAVESAGVIEAAYAAESVDEMFAGSWPNVQVELGLKQREEFTEEELKPKLNPEFERMREMIEAFKRSRKPSALELGLPVDPSTYSLDDPSGFKTLLPDTARKNDSKKKGFDTTQKKGKKKGKKKR
ncbi:DUF1186 domain-containing protein [Oscillatoria sp. CS-180]|uniref:DUF1186 domain-containing protein n=1 Tax=Oscillatoria sp. CS-180 TaxID=3021720 RepID=UPI00232C4134|nr:DUF1186 domain-containing protein [Oscillatoria sp. CS-180]MDB9525125.1 DUF1186 domain-containing protein [Oscillatoria sp. CS-180]